jgi:DNA polymerase epsilon subunit 1
MSFVISTVRRISNDGTDQGDALSKISLHARQFHSQYIFLDEYNFGTIHLERLSHDDLHDDVVGLTIPEIGSTNNKILTSVVTAWSMINYLGCRVAKAYFRAIIGKFSNDVFNMQMQLASASDDNLCSNVIRSADAEQVVQFKKDLTSNTFASYLTRAVGEIEAEGTDKDILPPYTGSHIIRCSPSLEFVKSVIQVLSLDTDIDNEVQVVKRSLFAQLGVAEYSESAVWKNPCPTLILPDVFCTECHESKDINLCHILPSDDDNEDFDANWICEDCGMPFSRQGVEVRLVELIQRKIVRYQLQDLRCSNTNRVATRTLACLSHSSATLKLDILQHEIQELIRLVGQIARFHQLEILQESIESFLMSFR